MVVEIGEVVMVICDVMDVVVIGCLGWMLFFRVMLLMIGMIE